MEVQYTLTTLDSLMLLPNHYCWIGTLRISVYVKVEEIKTLITICECQHACFKMHALKTTCVCVLMCTLNVLSKSIQEVALMQKQKWNGNNVGSLLWKLVIKSHVTTTTGSREMPTVCISLCMCAQRFIWINVGLRYQLFFHPQYIKMPQRQHYWIFQHGRGSLALGKPACGKDSTFKVHFVSRQCYSRPRGHTQQQQQQ